jgi:outer membrane protein OmpA-like peptidoglycan-associated protein
MKAASLVVVFAMATGCSLVTVKQDPFPTMEVKAERPAEPEPDPPPPPPKKVVVTEKAIEITEKVQFATGSAEILEESHALLNEVADVLKENPRIKLVQVEGHTDSTGGKRLNKRLSKSRAQSVMTFLVEAGVEKGRLKFKGFGQDSPIGDNGTDEGREQNRRVEFNILKQDAKEAGGDGPEEEEGA